MSVLYPRESEYAKERIKFEAQHTEFGPGLKPYVFRPLPMMMHKAGRPVDVHGEPKMGRHVIVDQQVAESDVRVDQLWHEGFRATPLEALEAFEAQQTEFAELAAERTYDVRKKLSPKAGAEVRAAEDAHSGHMPVMPETPIKRRGRPKKAAETGAH